MSGANDREVDEFKSVSCAVLLERQASPYTLDKSESTRDCLKYRRGKGEIILVTHGGRGWWDPGSATAKGDIFNLVQHLEPASCIPSFHFDDVLRRMGWVMGCEAERSQATGLTFYWDERACQPHRNTILDP